MKRDSLVGIEFTLNNYKRKEDPIVVADEDEGAEVKQEVNKFKGYFLGLDEFSELDLKGPVISREIDVIPPIPNHFKDLDQFLETEKELKMKKKSQRNIF